MKQALIRGLLNIYTRETSNSLEIDREYSRVQRSQITQDYL